MRPPPSPSVTGDNRCTSADSIAVGNGAKRVANKRERTKSADSKDEERKGERQHLFACNSILVGSSRNHKPCRDICRRKGNLLENRPRRITVLLGFIRLMMVLQKKIFNVISMTIIAVLLSCLFFKNHLLLVAANTFSRTRLLLSDWSATPWRTWSTSAISILVTKELRVI